MLLTVMMPWIVGESLEPRLVKTAQKLKNLTWKNTRFRCDRKIWYDTTTEAKVKAGQLLKIPIYIDIGIELMDVSLLYACTRVLLWTITHCQNIFNHCCLWLTSWIHKQQWLLSSIKTQFIINKSPRTQNWRQFVLFFLTK